MILKRIANSENEVP